MIIIKVLIVVMIYTMSLYGQTQISWTCTDPDSDVVTCDIYFGIDSIPPLIYSDLYTSHDSVFIYNIGTLSNNTVYYWKVLARDEHGAAWLRTGF